MERSVGRGGARWLWKKSQSRVDAHYTRNPL